ncbi:zinc finger protein [Holotrichia oblita]|uniref:Zinc finger protein n=1 Tax=Holotrichia oblita TaxID=644536 RepID=A0ACB9SSD1_HOLOL|nr:zinc finger protein [Holotrichia oblita]
MDSENIVCPVCTLFLRPGITLKAHLSSHPKQKVIEALVRISNSENDTKTQVSTSNQNENLIGSTNTVTSNSQQWNSATMPVNTVYPNFNAIPGNHSFIYQQFMSSSTPPPNVLNVNPLTQQIVTIPTVFNSQMMCPPYVYQQQQVIMSSGPSVMSIVPKPLPIELPASSSESRINTIETEDDQEEDEPDLVTVEISEISKNDDINLESEKGDSDGETELNKIESQITDIKDNADYKIEVSQSKIMQGSSMISNVPIQQEISENVIEECVKNTDCDDGASVHEVEDEYGMDFTVDLNKSCQTQTVSNYGDVTGVNEEEEVVHIPSETENKPSCYYAEVQESITNTNYTILQNSYDQTESTYTSTHTESLFARSHEQNTTSVIDMDGMNLFINTDFLNNHLVSQVDDFECANTDRPRIILNLGSLDANFVNRDNNEESLSRESANIRTDEHMPPRGELSGQESNGGTSDVNWNRLQYQEVCSSYDLIARENWNDDISDTEPNSAPNQNSNQILSNCDDDTPTVSGFREPPITYKCPTCGDSFNCPKERRVHQREHHNTPEKKEKEIGSQIGGKRVKKLTIKPKKPDIKTENNFDNVFTNRLKLETTGEGDRCDVTPQNEIEVQKKEDVTVNNPNICTVCDMVVADNNALKQHQLEAHNLSSDVRHKCKTCEETFPNESKYTEHLRTHPLECRLCGKYFYRKQNMQLHMKRHLGIKPYKCNICEKAFLTKQKHDEHKNIHTGDTPIKCNMCDETFRRHSNLVQHRNRHHFNMKRKMKDYVCFCGEVSIFILKSYT